MVIVVFVSFKIDFFFPCPFYSLWELHPVLITAPLSQFGYSLLFPLERNCYRNEGFVCLVNWVNRAVMLMLQGLRMRNDSNQDVTVHSAH